MDLQTALVCLAVFLISAVVVYLISVFGMRETTYEEAIAQQRRKDEESLQLKKLDKTSTKVDKKHKKWGRKSKEKSEGKNGDDNSGEDLHVGFKAEAEIIPELKEEDLERRASASLAGKGSKKVEDPKSILINKKHQKEKSPSVVREDVKEENPAVKNTVKSAETVAAVAQPPPPVQAAKKANKESKRDSSEGDSKEGSPVVSADSKGGRKSRESSNEKEEEESSGGKSLKKQNSDLKAKVTAKKDDATAVVVATAPSSDTSSAPSPVKKAKKVKADEEILTCSRLANIIKSSVLSPNEITTLIETLLNKQQAEIGNEEWLQKGQKVDPITALRKQLQEKEEALAEEKVRSQTAGVKIKELRQELNAEKSRLAQLERNLKDRQQQELQTAHSHLQMATNEANNLRSQLQQAQAKLNEDHLIAKKQMDDNGQLTQALNVSETNNNGLQREVEELRLHILSANDNSEKLLNDTKQLQEHIRQLEISKQEDENAYKQQINDLAQQFHMVGEENARLVKIVDENRTLSEEAGCLKHTISEMTISASQNEDSQNRFLKMIEDVKVENSNLEKQIAESVLKCNQYHAGLSKANDELAALKLENELLSSQLSKLLEREEAEGQEGSGDGSLHDKSNGHIQLPESEEISKISVTDHENILQEKDKMVERLTFELGDKNNELNDIRNQLAETKEEVDRLASDTNLQRQKNNELREKNWKVVEALNAAEKSTNDKIRQADRSANERLLDVQKGEQKFAQEIFERLFPEIRIDKTIVYPEWMSQFEKQAQQVIGNLGKVPEPAVDDELRNKYNNLEDTYNKLQHTVQNYKVVLAETEGMLNKLQGSVEEEEQRWKEKLEAKELELQKLLEERRSFEIGLEQVRAAENAAAEMQVKLKELHEKLEAEENERRLLERYKADAEKSASHFHEQLKQTEEQLEKLKAEKEIIVDSAKELETFKEDVERLKQQVKELSSSNAKLNGQLKIGQDALREEQDSVKQLQEELKLCRSETKQPNATNGQTTDNGDSSVPFEATPEADPNSSTSDLISNKKSKSKKRVRRRALSDPTPMAIINTAQDDEPHIATTPTAAHVTGGGREDTHLKTPTTAIQHSFSSACLHGGNKSVTSLGPALYPLSLHTRMPLSGSLPRLVPKRKFDFT